MVHSVISDRTTTTALCRQRLQHNTRKIREFLLGHSVQFFFSLTMHADNCALTRELKNQIRLKNIDVGGNSSIIADGSRKTSNTRHWCIQLQAASSLEAGSSPTTKTSIATAKSPTSIYKRTGTYLHVGVLPVPYDYRPLYLSVCPSVNTCAFRVEQSAETNSIRYRRSQNRQAH